MTVVCALMHELFVCTYIPTDIDECAVDTDGCEDDCEDTEGSFICICRMQGYEVGMDMRSCVGQLSQPCTA